MSDLDIEAIDDFDFDIDDIPEQELSDIEAIDIDDVTEWEDIKQNIDERGTFKQREQVGMARAEGVEDIFTSTYDSHLDRISRIFKSDEEIYNNLAVKIKNKYELSNDDLNNCLRMIGPLKRKNRGFQYKNPGGIMFAMMCLQNWNINMTKFNYVYNNYAVKENMTKIDLLRYCFLLIDINKN